jgi:hypothetical protein
MKKKSIENENVLRESREACSAQVYSIVFEFMARQFEKRAICAIMRQMFLKPTLRNS